MSPPSARPLLPAVAFGASQVVVIAAGSEDREYLEALREQMAIGETILAALGFGGTHFAVLEAREPQALHRAFAQLAPAAAPAVAATFLLANDKRTAVEFAVEHLVKHAPRRVDAIALPPASPYRPLHGCDRHHARGRVRAYGRACVWPNSAPGPRAGAPADPSTIARTRSRGGGNSTESD